MRDLLVLISKEMPLSMHINEMEKNIAAYKEAELLDEDMTEVKQRILMAATMITLKLGTEQKSTAEVKTELDKAQVGRDLMNRLTGDNGES